MDRPRRLTPEAVVRSEMGYLLWLRAWSLSFIWPEKPRPARASSLAAPEVPVASQRYADPTARWAYATGEELRSGCFLFGHSSLRAYHSSLDAGERAGRGSLGLLAAKYGIVYPPVHAHLLGPIDANGEASWDQIWNSKHLLTPCWAGKTYVRAPVEPALARRTPRRASSEASTSRE